MAAKLPAVLFSFAVAWLPLLANDGIDQPVRTEAGLRTSRQTYYDANYLSVSAQDQAALNDAKLVSVTHSDDLGRPFLTRTTPDTGGAPGWNDATPESVGNVVKRLRYPACPLTNAPFTCTADRNRYEAVSNPYRAGQTAGQGWTRTRIDPLGRTVDVTTYTIDTPGAMPPPWSGTDTTLIGLTRTGSTLYAYDADLTTVTDPAGKVRTTRTDAFGRIAQVIEDPTGLNYSTTYSYDTLDNLTNVNQGAQTRTFAYSSLSRLTSAINPESGQMTYSYDLAGNLLSRLHRGFDANGNVILSLTTSMPSYDALNRITGTSYSDGTPAVSYSYDTCAVGRGRLCSVSNSVSTASLNYDSLGRVINSTQSTSGVPYLFRYQYNPAGGLTSVEYPSATKVSYSYNQANRIIGARKGEAASTDFYLSNATYSANGAPSALTMGNSVIEETSINSLQQVTSISAKRDTTTLWRSDLTYNSANNNGNIANQVISGTHGATALSFSQGYEYDNLNRLSTVLDSGAGAPVDAKTQVFVYDRYGNRALKANSINQGGVQVTPANANPAGVEAIFPNNKLNNCCNAFGDTTAFNGRTMTYDGEHRVKTVAFANGSGQTVILEYFYDGDGRRIRAEKKVASTLTSTTIYVYDASGQLMAEYATPVPVAESNGRQYLTQDHLGSTRLVTKSSGTATDIVFSRHDFLPFGEEIARGLNGYGPSPLSVKFTSKERDAETALDFMEARYFSGAQGRFTSPDEPLLDQSPYDPQSWNLYAYVRNNPLRYTDPTGRCSQATGGYTDEGSGLFPGPCSGGTIGDSKNNTNSVTVGVGRDEANLVMLQGVGQQFSVHGVAQFVSDAAQATGRLTGATDVAQCLTSGITGSGCSKTGVAMAMIPGLGQLRLGAILRRACEEPTLLRCLKSRVGSHRRLRILS